jgi:hypothetical protein
MANFPKLVVASELKVGDVILPPAREMRLWMRRALAEGNRPESDLNITITAIEQGRADKRGEWLVVRGTGAFLGVNGWKIKMRPGTMWPIMQRAA